MDPKYRDLVRHILRSYDMVTEMAAGGGVSEQTKGENAALRDLLAYLKGREGLTLDGLREKFKEGSP